jgi:hypothetical protein
VLLNAANGSRLFREFVPPQTNSHLFYQGRGVAEYRCEARTIGGFVQQLAVAYVTHGYWFYVTGEIPERKDPATVDQKLIALYGVEASRWSRVRRKHGGLANVHYLRYGRFFVIVATKGEHRFFEDEPNFKDIRKIPIKFAGYSIGCRKGTDGKLHPSVRIHREQFKTLKAWCLEIAPHWTRERIEGELSRLPFEAYAPIRTQLLILVRAINRARAEGGLELVSKECLRLRRAPVKPFKSE